MKKLIISCGVILVLLASYYFWESAQSNKREQETIIALKTSVENGDPVLLPIRITDVMRLQPKVAHDQEVQELLAKAIQSVVTNYQENNQSVLIKIFVNDTLKNTPSIIEIPEARKALVKATEAHFNYILDEYGAFGVEGAIEELQNKHPDYAKLPEITNVIAKVRKEVAVKEEELKRSAVVVWQNSWSEKLPDDFKGSRIKDLFEQLEQATIYAPLKDEFTTNENYKIKLEEYYSNAKVGFATIADQILLTDTNLSKDQDNFGYDAELQQFYFDASKFTLGIVEKANAGKYQGENAFGVKKDITKINWEAWQTHYEWGTVQYEWGTTDRLPEGKFPSSKRTLYGNAEIKVEMIYRADPETARQLKDKIGAAFIISLVPPYAKTTYMSNEPTLSSPVEEHYTIHRIYAHLDKVVLYRTDTMEVLSIRDYE
ncbi:hypothetical protein [Emcibacter nanhaiensis]|uniref:Uncharacterized protein n=1 Tax=Emcibacter nanhaiensis TaxID=1505037 RepID=A0A501PG17_9PROT|nr:hypothetical protein [Emcibacter nanhaiensis]TPD58987.1 hypothetical protein FIV46_12180 [Emcibacter nanhaiensis]